MYVLVCGHVYVCNSSSPEICAMAGVHVHTVKLLVDEKHINMEVYNSHICAIIKDKQEACSQHVYYQPLLLL